MDVFTQRHLTFSKHDSYAERHGLFRLFQYMLERLVVDRPEDPISYLQELLVKGFRDVPQILFLGPPTCDRKVLAAALEIQLNLVRVTQYTLLEHAKEDHKTKLDSYKDIAEIPPSFWADVTKRRIEKPDCVKKGWILEGFPRTREQAFRMLKSGIFATHIMILEPEQFDNANSNLRNGVIYSPEELREYQEFREQRPMLEDFFTNNNHNVRLFKHGTQLDELMDKAELFARQKEASFVPHVPRVLLFGPPGSGKKTLAAMIASKYPINIVNFNQILQQAVMTDGPMQSQLEKLAMSDEPAPDELLARIAADRLLNKDCIEVGWIMYDFPFNLNQAQILTKLLEGFQANKAVFLDVDVETSMKRLEPRRMDTETGRVFHLVENRPPDDYPRPLVQRDTDTSECITEDYKVYQSTSAVLKGYYQRNLLEDIVFEVDATTKKTETFEVVENLILGSSKRRFQDSNWWNWVSRNSGIY